MYRIAVNSLLLPTACCLCSCVDDLAPGDSRNQVDGAAGTCFLGSMAEPSDKGQELGATS